MSYAANINKQGLDSFFFLVVKPRRLAEDITLHSGSVYKFTFTYGYIAAIKVDGVALTLGTSATLAAGEFYYDNETGICYLRKIDSSDPSAESVVATYEIYLSSKTIGWYRKPTDSTTNEKQFYGVVITEPEVADSVSEGLFGFYPVQDSTLVCANDPEVFQKHLYDSSFKLSEIDMYRCVGELLTDNIQKVYSGLIEKINGNDNQINFGIVSRLAIFDRGFDGEYLTDTYIGDVHPDYVGRPIPYLLGYCEGVRGINVDYAAEPTAGLNDWYLFGQANQPYNKTFTGTSLGSFSGTNTTTKTYGSGFGTVIVGERIQMNNRTFPTIPTQISYVEITGVGSDADGNYIEHVSIGTPMPNALGTGRWFPFRVPRVSIIMDGTKYEAFPGRDYSNASGYMIAFTAGYDSNIGLPRLLGPNDVVYGTVRGSDDRETITGYGTFGDDDASYKCIVQPIPLLYYLLINYAGITEAEIDTDSFTDLHDALIAAGEENKIGFTSPDNPSGDFPTLREIIEKILVSCLLRMYLNEDNKWTIAQVGPVGASEETISDYEIQDESFNFEIDYNEVLSDVVVEYRQRDLAENPNEFDGQPRRASYTNNNAKYLHDINRQRTFSTVLLEEADATRLARRLSYIFGDRILKYKLGSGLAQSQRFVGETVTLSRTKLPGYDYDADTERTRAGAIVSIRKNLDSTALEVDDQKGIEDNSGVW